MRTVGIVAEYNPLHTGHEYHIQKAKELAGADYAIVVMSPDFVQRGEPAVFEKRIRTEMALRCGADLVIELPVCYAAGSAEYFAEGAVGTLDALRVTDVLCFGAEGVPNGPETDSAKSLSEAFFKVARILLEEPKPYQAALRNGLRQGLTFPQARADALGACGSSLELIASPNNILGAEYCKALLKFDSAIRPLPIERVQSAYASEALTGKYCSAAALRRVIKEDPAAEGAAAYIPAACADLFAEACKTPVTADDFLPMLTWKLLHEESFDDISDLTPDLSDRILNQRFACIGKSFDEITALLKTRQVTDTRIRRVLLHLILGIRTEDVEACRRDGPVFYAKVSGFRASSSLLLHEIKKKSAVPLITKASGAADLLSGQKTAEKMWKQDLYAAHLYRSILTYKYRLPFRSEYELSPVMINS